MSQSKRIEIQEVIYNIEKCLGLNGVDAYEYIDAYLGAKHKTVGRYMNPDDLIHFKEHFMGLVDEKKSNPLDIERYHRNIDSLINYGIGQSFRADIENGKRQRDPYIKTVTVVGSKHKYY